MSVSSRMGAALIAVALSACAHQTSSYGAPSYAGGRAAQPGGFATAARASYERTPDATRSGTSYLGGQAGQPSGWLAGETPRVASTSDLTSCAPAGRAAQPFSGPSLHAVKSDATHVACRSDGAPTHF